MPSYEYEEQASRKAALPIVVLVGIVVGLLYVGPSSWSWRGLLAPSLAGVVFVGVFLGCGALVTRVRGALDRRPDRLFRMTAGFVSGGTAGVVWSLVERPGQSPVIGALIGAGLGTFMGAFDP